MSFLRRGTGKSRNFILYLGADFTVSTGDTTVPTSANSAIRFNTNGTYQAIRTDSGGILTQPATVFSVSNPNVIANTNFYVRANVVSGISPSGKAIDTWLQTSSAQTWYVAVGSGLSDQSVLDIYMTTNPNGSPIDRVRVTLSATASGGA